ncbi:MAG: nucleoside deaminase [Gaiella sp.]
MTVLHPSATPLSRRRLRGAVGDGNAVGNPRWVIDVVEAHPYVGDGVEALRLAVDLSRENVLLGTGGPFGAVVIDDATGELLAAGVNGVERLASSLAHAETVALAAAERRLASFTLAEVPQRCTLYSSCEPCAMCLGAIVWSGIPHVVYAAHREDAEAIGFDEGPVLPNAVERLRERGITLEAGRLRLEAAAVLRLYAERGGLVYNGGGSAWHGP